MNPFRPLRALFTRAAVDTPADENSSAQFLAHLRQDLGYGLRGLRRNPGFALVVILTLGLGIGANTAIFSVVNGVLLRPLPYHAPDRLYVVQQAAPNAALPSMGMSALEFSDFRARTRVFSDLAEHHSMWFILLGRPEPERLQTSVVSANFFGLLGIKPLIGRTFVPEDDQPGAAAVLVLSYDYWQRSFGGDPQVIGRVFEMNNKPHTVVGVLPPLPDYPSRFDVLIPTAACPFRMSANNRTNRKSRMISDVIGRLRDGVTPAQALEDVRRVGTELCGEFPASYPTAGGYTVNLPRLTDVFTGQARTPLLLLLASAGFVLLITCANVANLTLARLVQRDRELAVRTALGASRGRIVRQLLTENLLLALFGGAAGLALAAGGVHLMTGYAGRFLPRTNEIAINTPVLFFTLAVALLTGLVVGSRPTLPAGAQLDAALKAGNRGSGHRRRHLRGLLVVAQVAISVPLLAGAGLAVRSLYLLQQVDPGLQTNRVLAATVNLNWSRYTDGASVHEFWTRVLNEVAKIGGVQEAAVSAMVPLSGVIHMRSSFQLEGQNPAPGSALPQADVSVVNENYYRTVGMALLRGREFLSSDAKGAPAVVIINQALAAKYWPDQDPVGRRISWDQGKTWVTIIGVVTNARQQIDQETAGEIHLSFHQAPGMLQTGEVLLRTDASPAALTKELREALRRVDARQPVTRIATLEEVRDATQAPRFFIASLLGFFSLLALLTTGAGIGGVLAFTVSQRTQEIGIRMALGASRREVIQLVLSQAMRLVFAGLALGVAAAWLLTRMMGSLLYGIPPTDPVTFATVVVVLTLLAVGACVIPVRRATSVSPAIALRST